MNSSDSRRILVGKVVAAVTLATSIISVLIIPTVGSRSMLFETPAITFGTYAIALGVLTWLMVIRQPRNGAVWTLAWTSVFAALQVAAWALVVITTRGILPGLTPETLSASSPAQLPLPAGLGIQIIGWSIVPAIWLPLTLGLLLFPDGRPPSPRWRWIGWWSVVSITVSSVATALVQNPWSDRTIESFSGSVRDSLINSINDWAFFLATVSAVVSAASLVVRYRRSAGEVRSQIGWIALGGSLYVAGFVVGANYEDALGLSPAVNQAFFIGLQSFLLASYGVAITKYRLYDIDVVVSRTVSYAVLGGFITGVYALIVVGVGTVVGGGSNLILSIVAVAVVAVAFEPLRVRVQRWANRLVYGERATPYEVLAQTTRRVADTTSAEETLARIVDLMLAGTGASEAVLWMKTGDRLRPLSASTPEVLDASPDVAVGTDAEPAIPGDASVLVRHRGEVLGAASIAKPRGQSVTRADEKMLADVAAGAGLLLRNIGLNTELAERADQLRASRRRLVEAHDAERHRLERDLHDGAQQLVVALKVKLGIARTLATREGADRVVDIIESLAEDTQKAVDEMRTVAHGIYPPLLESEGLPAALAALARSATVPVVVDADGVGRYGRALEETVYFCVLETVTRATDAAAQRVSVTLAAADSTLAFTVGCDVPIGGLDMVVDRVDSLGGMLGVTVDAERTVLDAELPIEARANAVGDVLRTAGGTRL